MQTTPRQTEPTATPPLAETRLYGVMHTHIDQVWKEVLPFIERALKYADGKYEAIDVYQALKNRDMQLWVALNGDIKACAITQIVNYPRKKICLMFLVAGVGRDDWLHFGKIIEGWAKEQGCTAMEGYCRPGWERVAKDYTKIHTILAKAI